MFTLTPSRSSSVLQIFPATKLFSDFLWAKMMFTHLSVFSHNKSVSVLLSLYSQSQRFLTLASKGKEKMKYEFYSLGCRKKNSGSQARSNTYYDHHAKNSNSSPPCLIIVHPSLAFMLSRVWLWRMRERSIVRGIAHVRYINILAWLRGFRVKIVNCFNFFCLSIDKFG